MQTPLLTQTSIPISTTSTHQPKQSFTSLYQQLPLHHRNILQHLDYDPTDIPLLYDLLITQQLHSGSDGSVLNTNGTYGFLMCNHDFSVTLSGMGQVPQTHSPTTPQRAEFYGGYAITILINLLLQWGGSTTTDIDVWIDNENVVTTNQLHSQPIGIKHHSIPDFDIWEMTQTTIQQSKCNFSWQWVKGHQDETTPYDQLSFEAKINVQYNTLADQAHYHFKSNPPPYSSVGSSISIYLNRQLLSDTNMRTSLYEAVHGPDIIESMVEKYGWTQDIQSQIDWDYFNYCYEKNQLTP